MYYKRKALFTSIMRWAYKKCSTYFLPPLIHWEPHVIKFKLLSWWGVFSLSILFTGMPAKIGLPSLEWLHFLCAYVCAIPLNRGELWFISQRLQGTHEVWIVGHQHQYNEKSVFQHYSVSAAASDKGRCMKPSFLLPLCFTAQHSWYAVPPWDFEYTRHNVS